MDSYVDLFMQHGGSFVTLAKGNRSPAVAAACKKGSAIAHIHAPPDDFKAWESHTKAIRDHCDVMIQYGISIQSVEQRRVVMKNKPEMISVAVGAHNLAFVGRNPTRNAVINYFLSDKVTGDVKFEVSDAGTMLAQAKT